MHSKKFLLTALSAVLTTAILAACTPATAPATIPTGDSTASSTASTTSATPTTPAAPSPESTTPYSAAEIAAHNSPTDCWVAANGQVYDITGFLAKHKSPLDQYCGETTAFETAFTRQHGSSKLEVLAAYQIGVLQ